MSDQQSRWLSLGSGELTAEVNPLGAQLSALRDRTGRDLLWDGDPSRSEEHTSELQSL